MSDRVKCFMLEPLNMYRKWLRRFSSATPCSQQLSYHNALFLVGDFSGDAYSKIVKNDGNPNWPTKCEACGYAFQDADEHQEFTLNLYKRADTGDIYTLQDAPPGAMWEAPWYNDDPSWLGPDGKALIVRCPGGHDWHIDGQASNCTRKDDKVHKCWVRHGTPPVLTVDKNGNTCQAGAGSIQTPNWHGFLRDGYLVT